VCGYTKEHRTSDHVPLPLAFIVLPLLYHHDTCSILHGTRGSLHAFADKFVRSDTVQADVLLDVQRRALAFRQLTLGALELGIRKQLLTVLTAKAQLAALSGSRTSGVPVSVTPLLSDSEKLGRWCAAVTLFEISRVLKVDF
jgi:hypothetical protein